MNYLVAFRALSVGAQAGVAAGAVVAAGVGRYAFWRTSEKSNQFNAYTKSDEAINNVDLTGQVAVVTGANAGIGKETTRVLVKQGCTVYMACRSLDKAEKSREDIIKAADLTEADANQRLVVMQLDLSSLQSVKKFATELNAKGVAIDFLINNAGIMALPEYKETADGFEMQFGTNHLGHFYLTKSLMPSLLRQRTSGQKQLPRVINLSSLGHFYLRDHGFGLKLFEDCMESKNFMGGRKNEYDSWLNYGISKSCNILFARELQKRYSGRLVSVSVHPGAIGDTDLGRHMSGWDALRFVGEFMFNPINVAKNAKDIPQGAATTLRCVSMTDEEIQPGHYYFNCRSGDDAGEVSGACLQDKRSRGILAEKLWQLSETLVAAKGLDS